MRTAVLNPKGGVGKSTIAVQVLPFYYDNYPILVEFDYKNKELNYFDYPNAKLSFTPEELRENLLKLETEENLIIDVGGNQAVDAFLSVAEEVEFLEEIDRIVIPVTRDSTSMRAIGSLLDALDEAGIEVEEKVILALNKVDPRVPVEEQFKELGGILLKYGYDIEPIYGSREGVLIVYENPIFNVLKERGIVLRKYVEETPLEGLKKLKKELARQIIELKKKDGLSDEEKMQIEKLEKKFEETIDRLVLRKQVEKLVNDVILPQKGVFLSFEKNPLLG